MTFLEAYTIVTKEFETNPYNRNAMTEAFMGGYTMATNKSYDWLFMNIGHYVNEQGFVETHELEKDFRKAMEE